MGQLQHNDIIILIHILHVSVLVPFIVANTLEPINFYQLPTLLHSNFSQPGDINIGVFIITWLESDIRPAEICSSELSYPVLTIQNIEAVTFAVDLVNRSPDLLPNVTLGFVILGSCNAPGPAIANSLSFLPRNKDTACEQCFKDTDSIWQNYDVIGVVSSGKSSLGGSLSSLYSVANLPIVGPSESSNEFSDKNKHPYFFRVISPDVYLIKSILSFVSSNGWSYISVLYIDDSYGQTAIKTTHKIADGFGICIAASIGLSYFPDFDAVATELLMHSRARVVVVFLWGQTFSGILQAIADRNATGHFIWLGYINAYLSEGFTYNGVVGDPAVGTIAFDIYSPEIPEFNRYLEKQNVLTSQNPWIKPIWEYLFDCSFDVGTCDPEVDILQSSKYHHAMLSPFRIDSILTFAHAAHDLLSEKCSDVLGKDARACITGSLLRDYMKNVTFQGYVNYIKFDENQEVKGKFSIHQFVYENNSKHINRLVSNLIGIYDASTEVIRTGNNAKFSWSNFDNLSRLVPWTEDLPPIEIPESVCSRPCVVGEYKIEKELSCCWECRRCRDNERLIEGNTSCEACPQFTWPDALSAFTTCIDIPLTYSTLDETIPMVLLSLSLFLLVVDVVVTVTYVIYRNERVIKASSKELSIIQLIAIFGGYINVIIFQTKPTQITCAVIFFLFCLTFVMLYSPLLVKAIRIYRIFESGKTNKQKLRFISPQSQMFIAVNFIAVQVILSTASYIFFSPGVHRTQPIWSEKYVELSCDLTLPGLASFLGYNIVLVSFCSIFAFKTRKLPDNFNESQFISMCVATTLLVWLAFVPTYFTADREFVRVFLLSVALLLNHSIALIFLFIPKIYAAIFLPPETTGNVSGVKK